MAIAYILSTKMVYNLTLQSNIRSIKNRKSPYLKNCSTSPIKWNNPKSSIVKPKATAKARARFKVRIANLKLIDWKSSIW